MLTKVAYVTLFVEDQDRALAFYTNVLGFEKRLDNPLPNGVRFLTVGLKGQELQVALWPGTHGNAKPLPGMAPGACIIETSDCRKAVATLKDRGVKFEGEIIEQPVALLAIFQDPDGNRLIMRENRPPPGR